MKLVIAGGAILDVDEVIKNIVEFAGGLGCKIGIIPLASERPYETWKNHKEIFEKFGALPILIDITIDNYKSNSYSNDIINLISSIDGIFFTGGVQQRIIDGLIIDGKETPVLSAIRQAFSIGKLISGSSAGAAMMSNPMIYEGMDMNVKVGAGLGFLINGKLIVDQHFIQRGRFPRLFEAMWKTGVKIGIGIDEGTAIKIHDNVGGVIGKSVVVILKMINRNDFKLSYTSRGDVISLDNLEIHANGKKKVLEKADKGNVKKGKEYVFDILNPQGFHNIITKLCEGENSVLEALVIRILDDKDYEKNGYAYKFIFGKGSDTIFYSEDKGRISTAININVHVERKSIKILLENQK